MRILLLLLVLVMPVAGVEVPSNRSGPFYDPTLGFEKAFMPILTAFSKARIQTTHWGFCARGDYPGAFDKSEREPSDEGLYLEVSVTEDVTAVSDESRQVGVYTERLVEIPSGRKNVEDLQIVVCSGPRTPKQVLKMIDTCIRDIEKIASARPSRKRHR